MLFSENSVKIEILEIKLWKLTLIRKTLGYFQNWSRIVHIAKGLYSEALKITSSFAAIFERGSSIVPPKGS